MAAGLIAGAFKGAADAVGSIAEGHIQDERRLSLEQQLSQMEEERQKRIAEHREGIRVKGRQSDTEQDIANQPRVTAAATADLKAKGLVKSELERDDVKAKAGDPAYLKGSKAVANAGRADPQYSPSEYAQAEAARMKVADEKRRRELLAERDQIETGNMKGDQRARALARNTKALEALDRMVGAKKPVDETDVVKRVKENYTYNDAGNKTGVDRSESVEKRRAAPASARDKDDAKPKAYEEAPRDLAQRKVGVTYSTPRGPAVWRGNGWELVR